MFCPQCGKELKYGAQFCGECGRKVVPQDSEPIKQDATTENPPPKKRKLKLKTIAIIAIAVIVLLSIINRSDDRKVVYDLIPEIFEAESVGLGYEEPIYPQYGSEGIQIINLKYTETIDGYTFEMYQVDGIVTITTLFGTQIDMTYEMKVGLDKNFDKSGMYYYILEDGTLFW